VAAQNDEITRNKRANKEWQNTCHQKTRQQGRQREVFFKPTYGKNTSHANVGT
jgi:hypothetical protein